MKKQHNFLAVAFTAILAIGSIVFISCNKADDIMPQNQIAANAQSMKDAPTDAPTPVFIINQWWTDSQGQLWHVKGSGSFINENAVTLNIKFNMPDGTIGTFEGKAEWMLPNDACVITSAYKVTPEVKAFIREFSWYLLY